MVTRRQCPRGTCVVLLLCMGASAGFGATESTPPGQVHAAPAPGAIGKLDPEAATREYLARITPEQKKRSDDYFEGGYWLLLWQFLFGAAVSIALLAFRWSARMRDLAERLTRFRPLQTGIYWAQYLLLTVAISFPLTLYTGFIREHQYGLATQNLSGWLGDRAKGLLVALILGGLATILLYGVVRRLGRTWWIWGSGVSVILLTFGVLISPVLISPLFNKYTRVSDETIRAPILRMARANGIQAQEIYQVDASRQTTRVSANVSGVFGTERITLNDNLLKRASLPDIEAVMGHEMGHYLMNHVYRLIGFFGLIIAGGFALLSWAFGWALGRWESRWSVRGIGDVAGLPLAVLIFSTYAFLLTPINNTFIRTTEYEADLFGLNVSRQPDGMAEVALKLSEYRKMNPTPLEEWLFFDHPSGRVRVYTAMRWKAEN